MKVRLYFSSCPSWFFLPFLQSRPHSAAPVMMTGPAPLISLMRHSHSTKPCHLSLTDAQAGRKVWVVIR